MSIPIRPADPAQAATQPGASPDRYLHEGGTLGPLVHASLCLTLTLAPPCYSSGSCADDGMHARHVPGMWGHGSIVTGAALDAAHGPSPAALLLCSATSAGAGIQKSTIFKPEARPATACVLQLKACSCRGIRKAARNFLSRRTLTGGGWAFRRANVRRTAAQHPSQPRCIAQSSHKNLKSN